MRLFIQLMAFAVVIAVMWLLMAYEYQRGHDTGLDEGKQTCAVSYGV